MTTFPAEYTLDGYYNFITNNDCSAKKNFAESSINDILWGGNSDSQIEYHMRGKDVDCGILTYRYWITINFPDVAGIGYSGPKCGANPLADITVLSIKIKQ